MKSPSDTTLYKPALAIGKGNEDLINRISNFVDGMRLESDADHHRLPLNRGNGDTAQSKEHESHKLDDSATRAIIQAEQFKAQLTPPAGNNAIHDHDNDDDFFHVSCHIDEVLKDTIERGEFVDLERLLPKERANYRFGEDRKLELVSRDGMAYFTPTQECKIVGLRKWEQAFRVYVAIYSKAQPQRASEIWQYVYMINVTAASYSWENVAFYDYTFRQLMSAKPKRSWAKMYMQGWNLAMIDPLVKNTAVTSSSHKQHSQVSGKKGNWKDFCCWKFNRNNCKSPECRWDHRCTYCGGSNHSFVNCRKRARKEGRSGSPRRSPKRSPYKKSSHKK